MKTITIKKIMSFKPCYSESELEEMRIKYGLFQRVRILDILDSDAPKDDILWLVLRPEIIPEMKLHELAVKFAEKALKDERKAGREPHPDSWKALKIKKQWMKNKATNEALSAAESAAWSAAWSAAESAAKSARSAAKSAAESAADSAARSAARSAVWSAKSAAWSAAESAGWSAKSARSAAESAVKTWQIKQVKKALEAVND